MKEAWDICYLMFVFFSITLMLEGVQQVRMYVRGISGFNVRPSVPPT